MHNDANGSASLAADQRQPPLPGEAPTIVLAGRQLSGLSAPLRSHAGRPLDLIHWQPSLGAAKLVELLPLADALVIGADAALDGAVITHLTLAKKLKLLQLAFAGHDWLTPEALPPGCIACNTHEHSSAIAEYVVASMLDAEIKLREIHSDFRGGSWSYSGVTGRGKRHGTLRGKTVGIVGYGHIGRAVSSLLAPFGVKLVALGRSALSPIPSPLSEFFGPNELHGFLGLCDYVVVSCSLNNATRGLISESEFGAMKANAVLINVSRGVVIDEHALYAALESKRIQRAYIDVWYSYPTSTESAPRPGTLPFEALENLVMTPHCSAWVEGSHEQRDAFLASNISAWLAGRQLQNTIATA